MSDTGVLERWNRDSESYRRYTETAGDLLASDPEIRAAHSEWEAFLVESHGEVFEQVDVPNPREQVFVDALYYDFVVDRILAFAEETFDFALANREPHHDTDALSVDFGAIHEMVVEAGSVSPDVAADLTREDLLDADVGFLRDLYEAVVSREVRLALGEYYTPRGVAELAVEALTVEDPAGETFLDPGCGSGVFLAVCIGRKLDALAGDSSSGEDTRPPNEIVRAITDTVFGIDLNPVAVKSAKLSYVLSLLPAMEVADVDAVEVPVYLADSLRLTRDDGLPVGTPGEELAVDHLVGNPPWITWNNLTEAVKGSWRDTYAERLDLLPHGGAAARLGHGNDDVSIPFAWVCIHRYLRAGGDASFVLKRAISKGPAGKLLRTGTVGDRSVRVRSVHDFTDLRPFGEQVGAATAVYTLEAGRGRPRVARSRGDGVRPRRVRRPDLRVGPRGRRTPRPRRVRPRYSPRPQGRRQGGVQPRPSAVGRPRPRPRVPLRHVAPRRQVRPVRLRPPPRPDGEGGRGQRGRTP
ncbi:hypothetical protein BRD15_01810 [Halobacteriales archaeon SW_6_65_15]|nr:MAG: hypothetical protein BRD15_01810 [Halobacteriales archaeon SW_6_65_15]